MSSEKQSQNSFPSLQTIIPIAFVTVLFLISWVDFDVDVRDPWYKAVAKVDSAARSSDPAMKNELLEEGGKELKELLNEHPYHARLYFFISYYYFQKQEWDSVIANCEVAIEKGKGALVNQVDVVAADLLGKAAINKSNQIVQGGKAWRDALDVMELAVYHNRNNAQLWAHTASIHTRINQLDSAINYYKGALSVNPNFEPARKNLANILFQYGNFFAQQRNFKIAENYYRDAQNLIPNNPDYNNNLGNILLQNGKTEESVKFFEQAIKLNPNNSTYKKNLQIAKSKLN